MSTIGEAGPRGVRGWLAGTTFRSLRHRNYRLYFSGQVVSLTGSWMQTTALMWLAWELTHDPGWPPFIMAANLFPACLLGAWGGWLADHFPKRDLVLASQSAFFTLALGLTLLYFGGAVTPWLLFALVLGQGTVMAFDLPARLALVPNLVPREDLINAVALNSLMFNMARLLGPAVAGAVLVTLGPGACFALNAVSYSAVLAALARMRVDEPRPGPEPGRRSVWGSLAGGFVVLAGQPRLGALVLLAGCVALCGWPLLSLLPALSAEALGRGEGVFSAMVSAVGAGALLAALAVATFGDPRKQRWFLLAGVGCVSAGLAGLSGSASHLVATGFCVLFGFGMILFFPTGQSMVQLAAPDAGRGRVMGVWAMTMTAAVPLGNLALGQLAGRWGVVGVVRLQALAAGVIFAALLGLFVRGRLRRPRPPGVPVPGGLLPGPEPAERH